MREHKQLMRPAEGESVCFGGLGVRFMIDGEESGGGFSLVEHPIDPRTLAAPLHRHANEDEYSFGPLVERHGLTNGEMPPQA